MKLKDISSRKSKSKLFNNVMIILTSHIPEMNFRNYAEVYTKLKSLPDDVHSAPPSI